MGSPRGESKVAKVRIMVTPASINLAGEGYQGPACEQAVKFFADRLDGAAAVDEHTQDFYTTPVPEQEASQ